MADLDIRDLSVTFRSTMGTLGFAEDIYDEKQQISQQTFNENTKKKIDDLDNNTAKKTEVSDVSSKVAEVSSVANQALTKATDAETSANNATELIQSVARETVTGAKTEDGTSLTVTDQNIIIPTASSSTAGVVKLTDSFTTMSGYLLLNKAESSDVEAKTDYFKPLMSSNVDDIVKVGITTNSQELTSEEKSKTQKWLGLGEWVGTQAEYDALKEFDENVKYYIV